MQPTIKLTSSTIKALAKAVREVGKALVSIIKAFHMYPFGAIVFVVLVVIMR